jgi:hypothetical protein
VNAESFEKHPAKMKHLLYTPEKWKLYLIEKELVRISAELEDLEYLIHDISQALEKACGSGMINNLLFQPDTSSFLPYDHKAFIYFPNSQKLHILNKVLDVIHLFF